MRGEKGIVKCRPAPQGGAPWPNWKAGKTMIGSGYANIVAALILAAAILWAGVFNAPRDVTEDDFAAWTARAVGDIRNDIVVNCGCCGEEGPRRAAAESF
jgi:hypothetical protein